MNQHKSNCQMSSKGWAASIPPRCTCEEKISNGAMLHTNNTDWREKEREDFYKYYEAHLQYFLPKNTADYWLERLDIRTTEIQEKCETKILGLDTVIEGQQIMINALKDNTTLERSRIVGIIEGKKRESENRIMQVRGQTMYNQALQDIL